MNKINTQRLIKKIKFQKTKQTISTCLRRFHLIMFANHARLL